MRKSRVWSLAVALSAAMSGASSINSENDEGSGLEEIIPFKSGKIGNIKEEEWLLRHFADMEDDAGNTINGEGSAGA